MLAGYLRVSTEQQERKGYSYEDQRKRFLQFAESQEEPYEIYEDVKSGFDSSRAGYLRLLADINDGKISSIWVIEFSRTSRDEIDLFLLKRMLIEKNVTLFINGVPTELQTPEGSLSYGMNAVLAGYERDRLKERLWRGRKAKIEKGEYWVTPEFYGYDWSHDPKTGKKVPKPNHDEIETVKTMYSWFVNDRLPYKQIAEKLNEMAIPSKLGSIWDSSRVSRTLEKTLYAGYYFYKGSRIESKYYPPIINEKKFNKAREYASTISADYDKRIRHNYHQCSSLLHCWYCGKKMTFHHKKWKTPKTGKPRYRDIYKINHPLDCKRRNKSQAMAENKLDLIMTNSYIELVSDRDSLLHFFEEQQKKIDEERNKSSHEVEQLQSRIEKLHNQKRKLIKLQSSDEDLEYDEDIAEEIKNKARQISQFEDRLKKISRQRELSDQELHKILGSISLTSVLTYLAGSAYQRRVILSSVLKDGYIKDRNIHLSFVTGKKIDVNMGDIPSYLLSPEPSIQPGTEFHNLLKNYVDSLTSVDSDINDIPDDTRTEIGKLVFDVLKSNAPQLDLAYDTQDVPLFTDFFDTDNTVSSNKDEEKGNRNSSAELKNVLLRYALKLYSEQFNAPQVPIDETDRKDMEEMLENLRLAKTKNDR